MSNLVDIKFHGELGKVLKKDYKLAVNSVKEAIHAVNLMSGKKLSKYFIKSQNFSKEYRILVNGKDIVGRSKRLDTPEKINESEIILERSNIRTIDVVPVVQGSSFFDFLLIVVAVILVVVGFMIGGPIGVKVALVIAGVTLGAAGISNLLARPPEFDEFKDNSKTGKRAYVFNGPTNVTKEGGSVPFGYGRLKIGSQVTDATFEITYADADISPLTT
tara:strand:+ start:3181 stop:3834 length:654 start_codon:yes stop_codon:yes gene_type:complete